MDPSRKKKYMNTDPSLPGQGFGRGRGISSSDPSPPVPSQRVLSQGAASRGGPGDPMEFKGLPTPHPILHVSYQRSR